VLGPFHTIPDSFRAIFLTESDIKTSNGFMSRSFSHCSAPLRSNHVVKPKVIQYVLVSQLNDFIPLKRYGTYQSPLVPCEWKAYLAYKVIRYKMNPVSCAWGHEY